MSVLGPFTLLTAPWQGNNQNASTRKEVEEKTHTAFPNTNVLGSPPISRSSSSKAALSTTIRYHRVTVIENIQHRDSRQNLEIGRVQSRLCIWPNFLWKRSCRVTDSVCGLSRRRSLAGGARIARDGNNNMYNWWRKCLLVCFNHSIEISFARKTTYSATIGQSSFQVKHSFANLFWQGSF